MKYLYVHKFNNIHKTNQFLQRHYFPKLTKNKVDNASRPVSTQEIESIINNLPKL